MGDTASAEAAVRALNHRASIILADHGKVDPCLLLGLNAFELKCQVLTQIRAPTSMIQNHNSIPFAMHFAPSDISAE